MILALSMHKHYASNITPLMRIRDLILAVLRYACEMADQNAVGPERKGENLAYRTGYLRLTPSPKARDN